MYSGEGGRRANVVWSLRTWLQSYNGACYMYMCMRHGVLR